MMKVFPEKKSDAEFIEAIRKKNERLKGRAIFQYGMAVFFLLLFLTFWGMTHRLHKVLPGEYVEMLTYGFFIGVILGCFAGLVIFFAIVCVSLARQEDTLRRTERLLIHFHDRFKQSNFQP